MMPAYASTASRSSQACQRNNTPCANKRSSQWHSARTTSAVSRRWFWDKVQSVVLDDTSGLIAQVSRAIGAVIADTNTEDQHEWPRECTDAADAYDERSDRQRLRPEHARKVLEATKRLNTSSSMILVPMTSREVHAV